MIFLHVACAILFWVVYVFLYEFLVSTPVALAAFVCSFPSFRVGPFGGVFGNVTQVSIRRCHFWLGRKLAGTFK